MYFCPLLSYVRTVYIGILTVRDVPSYKSPKSHREVGNKPTNQKMTNAELKSRKPQLVELPDTFFITTYDV